ncbi:MAG: protein translocase subunit SecF [Novibacillus thermophilus]|uniref:Protein-export membrane protein SecF n=1 Tax=Novibacillus thermophilus TaxID=1471761 RepID=A0A1U9K5C7_9BACL|nr:protein translocase subunit SecF [Novibacillus thermophilus]AQS55223.1 protein-export membrane protein SecF [Novibacillus thermophilus]
MNYKFDFVGKRKLFFLVSGVFLLAGILSLLIAGLNLGIDFVSGTRLDIQIDEPFTVEQARDILEQQGIEDAQIRVGGNDDNFAIVNVPMTLNNEQVIDIREAFQAEYGEQVDLQEQVVSPVIGRELARNAVIALLLASLGIIIYVAVRFEYRFAVAAILTLFHDALFTVGMFSILQIEVDLTFIAAVLTIVGYSVNDTIVIFDRIREHLKVAKIKEFQDLKDVVNVSIQETLVRSINTGITVLFTAAVLFLFGGETIAHFSLALLFGLTIGMYSSIFIASPLWATWKWASVQREKKRAAAAGNS